MTLFAGPLFEALIVEEAWRDFFSNPGNLLSKLSSPIGFRNYIAGPFSEELLFRSLLIPLNLLSPQVIQASTGLQGTHAGLVMFTTPLYFGVAHIHHLYEFRLTRPDVPFKFALIQSLFQLCYTTLFGWYAAFVFLRTGSLWTCVLTHSFCNWMGLPRLWGRVERPRARQAAGFTTMTPKAPVAMGPPKHEPGMRGTDKPGKLAFCPSHARVVSVILLTLLQVPITKLLVQWLVGPEVVATYDRESPGRVRIVSSGQSHTIQSSLGA